MMRAGTRTTLQPPEAAIGGAVRPAWFLFGVLAGALGAATLFWHVPMMLWDHLEFAPLFEAWRHDAFDAASLFKPHNGHLYAALYLVLFATTGASAGAPWLDCLLSWLLLIGYAAIIVRTALRNLPRFGAGGGAVVLLVTFLALYPGHLSNLQWGWQLGVLLCLFSAAAAIRWLTQPILSWTQVFAAWCASMVALFSFATAIALIPVAFVLLALRNECTLGRRFAYAGPWLITAGAIAAFHLSSAPETRLANASAGVVTLYALNYLGAGIARFATGLAPALAVAALVSALMLAVRLRGRREALPWIGWLVFGLGCALLTALARAGSYGDAQAFVSRYVSFSSTFWIGWLGLAGLAAGGESFRRWRRAVIAFVALLAFINSVQMAGKASRTGAESRALAAELRAAYPAIDESLLRRAYSDDPAVARQCIESLHRLRFPPFDDSGPAD